MRIVGIDCGVPGAVAMIDTSTGTIQVFDAPVTTGRIGGKNRSMYCPDEMVELLRQFQPVSLAVIEHQQVLGKEGIISAYTIGYGYALWIMAATALKIPREVIKPADWKRAMLMGRDKEMARARAIELFPALAGQLSLKKHHGRAEALLLAEYGRRYCN